MRTSENSGKLNAVRSLLMRSERCASGHAARLAAGLGGNAGLRGAWSAAVASVLIASVATSAWAGPEGEQVVRGNVTISRDGANTLIRASDRSIINFKSFDIGAGESVRFLQPSRDASVLNRITSAAPTRIDGSLSANGRVYLVNPAGVIFGANSRVDVARLFAAAGHMSDTDFVRGIDRFTDLQGRVVNYGTLTGDFVGLLGDSVENAGTIKSERGTVIMAAGDTIMVGERLGNIFVRIEGAANKNAEQSNAQAAAPGAAPKAPKAAVENTGRVDAGRGRFVMGTGDVYGVALRAAGQIKAREARIEAQGKGEVHVTGTIDATGGRGEKGGKVQVLGEKVAVTGTIDASGPRGGGEILVGGNFQGKGPERNAEQVIATRSALLKADATERGDGGTIIVWSDVATNFSGNISARGGNAGGDGGFAEVSGKVYLGYDGRTDLRAPKGRMGTLLLDPRDIDIVAAGAVGDDALVGAGDNTIVFADFVTGNATNDDLSISVSALTGDTSNIILQANRDIFINTDLVLANNGQTVTLRAGRHIEINNIVTTQGGAIIFTANDSGAIGGSAGSGRIDLNAALDTTGNDQSGGIITLNIDGGTGRINVNSNGNLTTRGGVITLNGPVALVGSAGSTPGWDTTDGGLAAAGANILLQSTLNGTGASADRNVAMNAGTAGSVSVTGAIGNTSELGRLQITNANNVTLSGATTAREVAQSNGSGTTTFTGLVTTSGANGIQVATLNTIFGAGATTTAGNGVITVTGGLRTSGNLTSGGAVTQNGAGGLVEILAGSDIVTTGDAINIAGTLEIGGDVLLNTTSGSAAGADITLAGIDADGAVGTGILRLLPGTGGATVIGSVGSARGLSELRLTGGTTLVAGALNAVTFDLQPATSATFNGLIVIGAGGLTVVSPTVSFNAGAVSSLNGFINVTASTQLTIANTNIDLDGSFTKTGAGATTLNRSIQAGDNADTISFTGGTVTVGSGVTLDFESTGSGGTVSFGAATTLALGANSLTITADEIDFLGGANSITGTGAGTLTLQVQQAATTIGLGNGAGTLSLDATDLAAISNDAVALIQIGRTNQSGTITIGAAGVTFNDAVSLRGSAGTIAVLGTLTGGDATDSSLTLNGLTNALSASLVTEGQAISVSGNTTLNVASVSFDSTNGGVAAAGSTITVNGTVNSFDSTRRSLTLNAGTGGTVSGTATYGQTNALNAFSILADSVTNLAANRANSLSITVQTAGSYAGLLRSDAGSVTLTGPGTHTVSGGVQTTGGGLVANGAGLLTLQTAALSLGGDFTRSNGVTAIATDIGRNGVAGINLTLPGGFDANFTGNSTIDLGTGTFTFVSAAATESIDLGGNTVVWRAGTFTFGAADTVENDGAGGGSLTLAGATNATTIGVGTGAAGTLQIGAGTLATFADGATGELIFGGAAQTGQVTVGTVDFRDAARFQAGGVGGIVELASAQVVTGTTADASLNFDGTTVRLGGTARTSSATITLGGTGNIVLFNNVTLNTAFGGGGTNLAINRPVESSSAGVNDFTVTTGTGDLTFAVGANVGATTRVGVVNFSGANIITRGVRGTTITSTPTIEATYNGLLDTSAAGGITLAGNVNTVNGGALTAGVGGFTASGTGLLTLQTAALSLAGDFTRSNGGTNIAANIGRNGVNGINLTLPGGSVGVSTDFTGASTIDLGLGTFNFVAGLASINLGGQTLVWRAGAFNFGAAGSIVGNGAGSLTLAGSAVGNSIGVGTGAGGALQFTSGTLATFANEATGELIFGGAGQTGQVNVGTVNFDDAARFQTAGTVELVSGAVVTGVQSDASLNFDGGSVRLGGTARTSSATITLGGTGNIVLFGNATLNTAFSGGGANLTIGRAVESTSAGLNDLTITTGTGTLTFSAGADVGATTRVGVVTLSGANINTRGVRATTITSTPTTLATYNGLLDTSAAGGITLAGLNHTLNAGATTIGGGTFTADNTGLLTIATTGLTLDGAFSRGGASGVRTTTLGANITTTNDDVTFSAGTGTLTVNADSIVNAGTATISLLATNINTANLTLRANTINLLGGPGSVVGNGVADLRFLGATDATTIGVGNGTGTLVVDQTDIDALAINAVGRVFFGSLTQTGRVTIGTASFLDSVVFEAGGAGGIIELALGETLSAIDATDSNVVLTGGAVRLGGTILTSGRSVLVFSPGADVAIFGNATIDTTNAGAVASGANINFSNGQLISSTVAGSNDLTLTAGSSGVITLPSAVGSPNRIGQFVASGSTVNTNSVFATTISITAVNATHSGVLNTTAAGGITLLGTAHTLNAGATTTGGGTFAANNTGLLTIANTALTLDGAFTRGGASGVRTTSLGANITTTNDNVTFDTGTGTLTLAANSTINAGTATITLLGANLAGFNATLQADAIDLLGGANSITGNGLGNLTFLGATNATTIDVGTVSGGTGTLVVDANDIAALANEATGLITFGSATQTGQVTIGASQFLDAAQFLAGGTSGIVELRGNLFGTDANDANLTLNGETTRLGANIRTSGRPIVVTAGSGGILLFANTLIDTTNGGVVPAGTDVTFSQAINSTVAGSNDLQINAGGSGNISLAAIGPSSRIGAFIATSGGSITTSSILAASINTSAATGTYNGILDTTGASGITIGGSGNHTLNAGATTTGGGTFTAGNGGVLALVDGADPNSGALTLDGAFTRTGGTTQLGVDLTTTDDAVDFATATSITATGVEILTGSNIANANNNATGGVTFGNVLDLQGRGLRIGANSIDFAGGADSVRSTVSAGNGVLVLRGGFATTTIGVGTGTGTLILNATDLAAIQDEAVSRTVIGGNLATHGLNVLADIRVDGTASFRDAVLIQNTGGLLVVASSAILRGENSDASIDLAGADIRFGGTINTAGAAATFNGPVVLTSALSTIDTTAIGPTTTGAGVNFTSRVDAATPSTNALRIDAGTGGIVSFNGDVGGVLSRVLTLLVARSNGILAVGTEIRANNVDLTSNTTADILVGLLDATGNLTVNSARDFISTGPVGAGATLAIETSREIRTGGTVSGTAVNLNSALVNVNGGGSGGAFTTTGGTVNINSAISVGTFDSTGTVFTNSSVGSITTTGAITINHTTSITTSGLLSSGSTLSLTSPSTTINGGASITGLMTLAGGDATLASLAVTAGSLTGTGTTFTSNAGGTITTTGPISLTYSVITTNASVSGDGVTLAGTTSVTNNALVDGGFGAVAFNGGAVTINGQVEANGFTSTGSSLTTTASGDVVSLAAVTTTHTGDVNLAGDISGTVLSITAGNDGTGTLTTTTANFSGDFLTLIAGNGAGNTANIVLGASTRFFGATGTGVPAAFAFRQDAPIADAILPEQTQFGSPFNGQPYTIQSFGGSITIQTASKFENADLRLIGTSINILPTTPLTLRALTTTGPVNIGGSVAASGDMIFNDRLTIAADADLGAGNFRLFLAQGADAGSFNLTLGGDEIDLGGTLTGTGILTLQPGKTATAILLGGTLDNIANQLDLTINDLSNAQSASDFSRVIIGRSAGTHAISTASNLQFEQATLIRASAAGGSILLANSIFGNSTGTLDFDAGGNTITLRNNVRTASGSIIFRGPVDLDVAGTITVDSTNGTASPGAAITFDNAVRGFGSGGQNFTATSGTGTITLLGGAGIGTSLGDINLSGATLVASNAIRGNRILITADSATITDAQALTAEFSSTGQTFSAAGVSAATTIAINHSNTISVGSLNAGTTIAVTGGAITLTENANSGGAQTYAGSVLNLGGDIASSGTGAITFNLPVLVNDAGVSIASSGVDSDSDVIFNNTLDSSGGARDLTVAAGPSASVVFNNTVGVNSPMATLTASGASIDLNAAEFRAAGFVLNSPVVIAASGVTVIATSSARFNSLVDSESGETNNLTVNAPAATFGGRVGGTFALGTLATSTGTTLTIDTDEIRAAVATFGGPVRLEASDTTIFGTSSISFLDTIDSVAGELNALVLNSPSTTLSGRIGQLVALRRLATDAAGTTLIESDRISVTEELLFLDPVTLGTDVLTASASSGSIIFENTLGSDATRARGVNLTANNVRFGSPVGGTDPTRLSTVTVSAATIASGNITTVQGQTYTPTTSYTLTGDLRSQGTGAITINGPLLLAADGIDIATNGANADDDIILGSIDSADATPRPLSLNAGSLGGVSLTGGVGQTRPLGAVSVTGTITELRAALYRAASWNFARGVNLFTNAAVTATSPTGTVTFAGNVLSPDARNSLTVDAATATFSGDIGQANAALRALVVDSTQTGVSGATATLGGGNIVVSESITFAEPVSVTNNTSITNTGTGAISFQAITSAGARTLSISSPGAINLNGLVGGTADDQRLGALAIAGGGATQVLANVSTTGGQTYANPTAFGSNVNALRGGTLAFSGNSTFASSATLTSTGINFSGSLDAANGENAVVLTLTAAGDTVVAGNVGATNALRLVTNGGGNTILGTSGNDRTITLSSGADFGDSVQLAGSSVTINGGTGSVLFRSTIDSQVAGATQLVLRSSINPSASSLTSAQLTPFKFGGNIGTGGALRSINIGADATSIPPLATAVFASSFNADGTIPASAVTGTLRTFEVRTQPGASSEAGFVMGVGQKLTTFGNLVISTTGRILVSDLTSLGSMDLRALTGGGSAQNAIVLRSRPAASVVERASDTTFSTITEPSAQRYLDIVLASADPNALRFSVNNSLLAPTVEGAALVRFANVGANLAGPLPQGAQIQKSQARAPIAQAGGSSPLEAADFVFGNVAIALDGVAEEGNVNVATAIAGAIPRDTERREIATSVSVSLAFKKLLAELNIQLKEVGFEQYLENLVGRSFYQDSPEQSDRIPTDYTISPNRLTQASVNAALAAYWDLFREGAVSTGADLAGEISINMQEVWSTYATEVGGDNVSGVGFRTWLEGRGAGATEGEAAALAVLDKAKVFVQRVAELGLSPKEQSLSESAVLNALGIEAEYVRPAVTGVPNAAPAAEPVAPDEAPADEAEVQSSLLSLR